MASQSILLSTGAVSPTRDKRRQAFTLNELLIVIAIIVLMLGLAVPAFNVLTGSRSIEGATNQISAMLGQARAEAIGVQEIRGVMFFIDPKTDRINMALVRDSGMDAGDGRTYLDVVGNREFSSLPSGVMVQTLDNPPTGASRTSDGYVGFNTFAGASGLTIITPYGGVILFDSAGKVISVPYGMRCSSVPASSTGKVTDMAWLLSQDRVDPGAAVTTTATDFVVTGTNSQIGIAMFMREQFNANSYTLEDVQISGGTYGTAGGAANEEFDEEVWIDNNATIQLVNRYNGTLIKAE